MLTHLVFGFGAAVALDVWLPPDLRLTMALVLSLGVNMVIDELGHVTRRGLVSRSPLTHSIFAAPIWGGVIGYLIWRGWSQLGPGAQGLEWPMVLLGAAVAGSHLLLDSLTERGVFVLTHRFALAHFSSRNVILNGIFVVLGVALVLTLPFG